MSLLPRGTNETEIVVNVIHKVAGVRLEDHNANLLEAGVKSIDMLRIVGTLETEFDVEFDSTHLTRENFASIAAIVEVIFQARDGSN